MRSKILILIAASFLQLSQVHAYRVEHKWAIITKTVDSAMPTVMEYKTVNENVGSDVETEHYNRIKEVSEDGERLCQYGYLFGKDKKIYVYDFENNEKTVAFDFNLSAGDEFTTMNGIEWVVGEVSDTLVMDFMLSTEPLKLLTVSSKDGRWKDQWLEQYGSFTNHLMILDLNDVEYSMSPIKSYELACLIFHTFEEDPFYAYHKSWVVSEATHWEGGELKPEITVAFANGNLTVHEKRAWSQNGAFRVFFRSGDDIFLCYSVFDPEDSNRYLGGPFTAEYDYVFHGLPEPASGNYTIHIDGESYSTAGLQTINTDNAGGGKMYDLQGRRLKAEPQKGVFIKDGHAVIK